MSPVVKTLCAGMMAWLASSVNANAGELSPGYVGLDAGVPVGAGRTGLSSRIYAGYTLGSTTDFGMEDVHAIEVMGYSVGTKTKSYTLPGGLSERDRVRGNGIGVNWASAMKINDEWSFTNRLGMQYTRARIYAKDGSSITSGKWGPMASVGMAYALNRNLSLTADLSYMPIKLERDTKLNAMLLTAGVAYRF